MMFPRSMPGAVSPRRHPPDLLSRRHPWCREGRLQSDLRKVVVDQVSQAASRAKPLERKILQHRNSNQRSSNHPSSLQTKRSSLTSSNSSNRRLNNNSNQEANIIERRITLGDVASADRETLRSRDRP